MLTIRTLTARMLTIRTLTVRMLTANLLATQPPATSLLRCEGRAHHALHPTPLPPEQSQRPNADRAVRWPVDEQQVASRGDGAADSEKMTVPKYEYPADASCRQRTTV